MNTAEGIGRLATVIRWIGDGFGVLLAVGGVVLMLFGNTADGIETAAIGLVFGAFFSGGGRAISWILQGFAKSD
jgi:hypothetical protein